MSLEVDFSKLASVRMEKFLLRFLSFCKSSHFLCAKVCNFFRAFTFFFQKFNVLEAQNVIFKAQMFFSKFKILYKAENVSLSLENFFEA